MEQEIRFCATEDGVRIAYATTGKGTPITRHGPVRAQYRCSRQRSAPAKILADRNIAGRVDGDPLRREAIRTK
jgi:hypothetical protein